MDIYFFNRLFDGFNIMKKQTNKQSITTASYITGFILSLGLTLTAYAFVTQHINSYRQQFSTNMIVALIIALAMSQLIVQLVFFLHIGKEDKPRWNIVALLFAVMVVVILVFGSLWIMNNLSNHYTEPETIDNHIIDDEGFNHR